jgi:hypothetical protein
MSSSITTKVLLCGRNCLRRTKRVRNTQTRALASLNQQSQQTQDSSYRDGAAAVMAAAVASGALYSMSNMESACDTKTVTTISLPPMPTTTEPRRHMSVRDPKNVMLHRMRSLAGRGLNNKYNVDWNTVIGEGAYGSVYPARLACTGEKVSRFPHSPSVIFETRGALLDSKCSDFATRDSSTVRSTEIKIPLRFAVLKSRTVLNRGAQKPCSTPSL